MPFLSQNGSDGNSQYWFDKGSGREESHQTGHHSSNKSGQWSDTRATINQNLMLQSTVTVSYYDLTTIVMQIWKDIFGLCILDYGKTLLIIATVLLWCLVKKVMYPINTVHFINPMCYASFYTNNSESNQATSTNGHLTPGTRSYLQVYSVTSRSIDSCSTDSETITAVRNLTNE